METKRQCRRGAAVWRLESAAGLGRPGEEEETKNATATPLGTDAGFCRRI